MGLGLSHIVKPMPDEERFAALDRAHKIGCTFWDTSDYYVCSIQTEMTDSVISVHQSQMTDI